LQNIFFSMLTYLYLQGSFKKSYGYINSNKGRDRVSAYTSNFTTLLLDNLPSWKGWPKRSKGIICSTDEEYSEDYGRIFYVIPYDSAKVAVAPAEDIFYSFKFLNSDNDTVRDFNIWIERLIDRFDISTPKTFNDLKKTLKILSMIDSGTDRYDIFKENDYMKTLDNLFNPDKNGFKQGIDSLNPEREVWIQGECIVVYTSNINIFLRAYKEYKWNSRNS